MEDDGEMTATLLPIWVKISYTLYAVVLVPVYWVHYGPANFLWFSDIAFLGTGVALWLESRMLASMIVVGTLVMEVIWNVDFFAQLITGRTLVNAAAYMFDPSIPEYLRALSGFHLFLPPLGLWLVHRLGYAPSAWKAQVLLACLVVPVSRLVSDEKLNVNWVYGPDMRQTRLPDTLYVALVVVVVVVGCILPGHLLLRRLFRSR